MKATGSGAGQVCDMLHSDKFNEVLSLPNESSRYEEKSMAALVNCLLQELEQTSEDAVQLLRVLCFLDPERIDIDILRQGAENLDLCVQQQCECFRTQAPEGHGSKVASLNGVTPSPSKVKSLGLSKAFVTFKPLVRSEKASPNHTCTTEGAHSDPTPNTIDKTSSAEHISYLGSSGLQILYNGRLVEVMALVNSPSRLDQAFRSLRNLSLVTQLSHEAGAIFWMHDLVQLILRNALIISSSRMDWLNIALLLVCRSFGAEPDSSDSQSWSIEKYVTHISAFTKHVNEYRIRNEIFEGVVCDIGRAMNAMGSFDAAAHWLERGSGMLKHLMGATHEGTIKSAWGLGRAYLNQGHS